MRPRWNPNSPYPLLEDIHEAELDAAIWHGKFHDEERRRNMVQKRHRLAIANAKEKAKAEGKAEGRQEVLNEQQIYDTGFQDGRESRKVEPESRAPAKSAHSGLKFDHHAVVRSSYSSSKSEHHHATKSALSRIDRAFSTAHPASQHYEQRSSAGSQRHIGGSGERRLYSELVRVYQSEDSLLINFVNRPSTFSSTISRVPHRSSSPMRYVHLDNFADFYHWRDLTLTSTHVGRRRVEVTHRTPETELPSSSISQVSTERLSQMRRHARTVIRDR